ncbi:MULTISPECIES: hypothetical protein [unclassified Vibrio]|uniref:hypothetical protein n=1 Tax=unclassified Vibrio TaxID=2614977 RepID=UPI000B8E5835|nr:MULTISPECIES: hypothetical protein [unclassified Vibrio]NAX44232.1 hypothetical protein [Vibrio sp. V25_P4S6T154]OXX41843.1 hypothetical protein B9J93_19160 [Vibrio sp. V17_P4S1T151]OXX60702.1 hypothetical protein B9J89_17020 [Vibrio sp. V15_P4S5T153]OXX67075.1 hypothetical protein B9J94_11330 [Vibrio sp. V20_P4S3T152]
MKIEVFRKNAWVQDTPNVGELCRITHPTGHVIETTYQGEHVASDVPELIPVVITSVQGASTVSSDFTKITVTEGSTIMVSGTLAISDKTFVTPIEQENISTGEVSTLYKEIAVIDGAFSVELTLPVGKYRITQELMNAELPQPAFSLESIEIYITI